MANVVMRRGHGHYGLADPFVQEIWAARNALMLPPVGKKLTGLPNPMDVTGLDRVHYAGE